MMMWFICALFLVGAMAAPSNDELSRFFKDKTKIENPFELRDPFRAPVTKSEKVNTQQEDKKYYSNGKGSFSNLMEANLSDVDIQSIKVNGVLIGKERRALVSVAQSKEVIILKEGMKLGPDGVELKAILPGGIVLVEKITNVYGQDEFLETVVPISK